MAYKTKQGQALLAYLKTLGGRHVRVADIAAHLPVKVGVTTIYRQLERMAEDGVVRKYITDGEAACYQYVGDNGGCGGHVHLKCDGCGKLIHLECGAFDELVAHLAAEHGFRTDPLRTALYGVCRDCLNKEKNT